MYFERTALLYMVKPLEAESYRIEAVFELSAIPLLDQCVGVARRRHRASLTLQFGYCGIITTFAIVLTDFLMHTQHDRTLPSIGNFLFFRCASVKVQLI